MSQNSALPRAIAADLSTTNWSRSAGSGTCTVFNDGGGGGAGCGSTTAVWALTTTEMHARARMPTPKTGESLRIASSEGAATGSAAVERCFSRANPDLRSRVGESSAGRRETEVQLVVQQAFTGLPRG